MWAVLFLRKTIAWCNSRIQNITIEQSSEIVYMLFSTKSRKLQTKNLQLFAISDSTLYITVLFLRRRIWMRQPGKELSVTEQKNSDHCCNNLSF